MKRIVLCGILGITLALMGCFVPSLHPYYQENDLTFEPALVGVWGGLDGKAGDRESWTFEKVGEKEYKFTTTDTNSTNVLSAHLFKLGTQLFLDCRLTSEGGADIPPHYLLRVGQIQPTLKTSAFASKWLEEFLKQHPGAIHHLRVQDEPGNPKASHVVLTAETPELQEFVLKHLNDEDAFGEMDEMKRR